ncbi:MAG: ribonuclease P protein component [Patescibacteria group bacterium]|nr:ribonuclease P protein component [Patescibacteria group bacterium]
MFKKEHRLAKTKDVKAAFEQGRGFFNPLFSVRRAFEKAERKRFTVVVSTKVSKNATVRNRIKRLVREFIRLNMSSLKLGDYIISVKPKALSFKEDEMLGFLKKLLIQAKIYENS